MKKILLFLLLVVSIASKGQGFPSTDSLHRFDNHFITNSAINAFTDYRLNTLLHGMINWIDSAKLGTSGSVGVDTLFALNDSTIRYKRNSVYHNFTFRGVGVSLQALNGITISGGVAKLGGNLTDALTIINARNSKNVIWDSTAQWIVRDAPGTTYINFNYADPSIQLYSLGVFWRIRSDGLQGTAINSSLSVGTAGASLSSTKIMTLATGDSLLVTGLPSTTDTTNYKPLGIASNGKVKSLSYWPGSSGGPGSTNISVTRSPTEDTIKSSTGTAGILPVADHTNAGAMSAADKARLDSNSYIYQYQIGAQPAFAVNDSTTGIRGLKDSSEIAHIQGDTSITDYLVTNGVGNSKLAQIAAHSYKGNNTGSTANVADITNTQLTADLNPFTSSLKGLAPASGGGTTNFLRADGSWAAPSGGSGNTNSNIGSGYRWAIPGTNNVKTVFPGTGISIDSTTNTNALTFFATGTPTVYVATDHLVVNDGQFARHASATSGSATITCNSCTFTTNAFPGQYFRMDSAGASGGPLVSTILSITDAHHIVLNTTAGTSVASKSIVWGTDNTAAITNLLDTIYVHGGGTAFFPVGGYIIAGSPVSPATINAQIVLPLSLLGDASFNLRTGINITGVANANLSSSAYAFDTIDAHTGTWFESIIDAPDPALNAPAPAVFGSFTNGGTTNFNYFFFQNFILYTPQNAGSGGTKMGGINCSACAISQGFDVLIASDGSMGSGDLPIHEEAGWIVNSIGCELTSSLTNVWISGHKYAVATADHTVLNNAQFFGNNFGVVLLKSAYPTTFVHVGTQQCRVDIYSPNSTILGNLTAGAAQVIGNFQIETFTNGPFNTPTVNWWNHFQEISDSGNHLIGDVTYFSNRNDLFTKYNGNNLICTQLGQKGNFPTPLTRTFALGDSATTTSTMTMGGKNGTTNALFNFIYNTANSSAGGFKFTMGTTDQMGFDGDNSGAVGLGYGTSGTNSGRELYFYDYPTTSLLGGAIGQTGDWVFGKSLTKNGLRVQQPSGNTRSFTVTTTGHLITDSVDNTSVPSVFQTQQSANSQVYGLLVSNSNSGSGNITNGLQMSNELGISPTHGASIRLLGNASGSPFNSALDLQAWDGPIYMNASGVRNAYFGSAGIQFATNAVAADASAYLDISSTTKGFLEPRGTTTNRNAISSPAEGLMFYDNTLHLPYWYDGTQWNSQVPTILNANTTIALVGNTLTISGGQTNIQLISGTGSAASISAGSGAGTSPTVTIPHGNSLSGQISVITGTGPSSNAIVCTITLPISMNDANYRVSLLPTSSAAASAQVYKTNTGVTTFTITVVGTLSASTTYTWDYMILQ